MSNYLVSYDLHKVRNYTGLISLLTRAGAVKILKSVWLIQSNADAGGVRDSILTTMDSDDSILVVELEHGSDWATSLVPKVATQWLSKNVTIAKAA